MAESLKLSKKHQQSKSHIKNNNKNNSKNNSNSQHPRIYLVPPPEHNQAGIP